jgi:hypothetical protein
MRRSAAVALCLAAFALVADASATVTPARGMWGLALGMTPAQVRAKLGEAATSGTRWSYWNVTVTFRGGRVAELTTAKRAERLSNGLGVSSTEAQLRRAFPSIRCGAWGIFRRCRLGPDTSGSRVTDCGGFRGRVFQIPVARLP